MATPAPASRRARASELLWELVPVGFVVLLVLFNPEMLPGALVSATWFAGLIALLFLSEWKDSTALKIAFGLWAVPGVLYALMFYMGMRVP